MGQKKQIYWHSMSAAEVLALQKSDVAAGLSLQEASKRLRRFGANGIWNVKRASAGKYAVDTIFDLATILLVITAVVSAIFHESQSALVMCALIVLCAGMRIGSYTISQRIFEKKAKKIIPRVRVVREGKLRVIAAKKIVPGDILLLSAGDTVPCDCRILQCASLLVFEQGITENKTIVSKDSVEIRAADPAQVPLEMRSSMLYAATAVVAGTCRAIATETGKNTLAVSRFGVLTIPSGENVPVIGKLASWCRICSLCMLGFVPVITIAGALLGESALSAFLSSMALAVASMSEFLPAIAYIIIARSVTRADRSGGGRAMIKNAASVEELTEIDRVVLGSSDYIKSGDVAMTAYAVGGKYYESENEDKPSAAQLLRYAYATTGSLPGGIAQSDLSGDDSSESIMLRKIFNDYFVAHLNEKATFDDCMIADFVSAGASISGGVSTALLKYGNEKFEAVCGGRAETILSLCTEYQTQDGAAPLTWDVREELLNRAAALREEGVRVYAVAVKNSEFNSLRRLSAVQMAMKFIGYAAVSEELAEGTKELVSELKEAGVGIVMLSDGSAEDINLAFRAGILEKGGKIVYYHELINSDEIQLSGCAVVCTGAGGDSADAREKAALLLREGCRKSAYIASRMEDLWAMRVSAVSFALPNSENSQSTIPQALRAASDVITVPSDRKGGGFADSVRAVKYSRAAMLNLRHAADYLLASQTARLLLLLAGAVSPMGLFTPIQLLVWGLLLDFIAVLAISFEKPPKNVLLLKESEMGIYPDFKSAVFSALSGVLWAVLSAVPVFVTLILMGVSPANAEVHSSIYSSALLCIPIVQYYFMTGKSLFTRGSSSVLRFFLSAAASVAAAVINIVLTDFSVKSISAVRIVLWIISVIIPSLIVFAASELIKSAKRRRNS